MPYIPVEDRAKLLGWTQELGQRISSPGELNYCISMLCKIYAGKANYQRHNEIIGVLECAKLERYRVFVGPYETEKMNQHGGI